ncbi:hypothetical protein ABW20_dc0109656 [Dactylellina cionopaga]|nr:hypothetical protein ABW20_dc0109656 [Dactylellina cionopaga]
MAPTTMNDAETVRFLLLCIEKCDTKSIDYEEIANVSGLNGYKAAYKRLWDLKKKIKSRDTDTESAPMKILSPQKVKKSRSPRTPSRMKRKEVRFEEQDVDDL